MAVQGLCETASGDGDTGAHRGYELSGSRTGAIPAEVEGASGLEPATSGVTGRIVKRDKSPGEICPSGAFRDAGPGRCALTSTPQGGKVGRLGLHEDPAKPTLAAWMHRMSATRGAAM